MGIAMLSATGTNWPGAVVLLVEDVRVRVDRHAGVDGRATSSAFSPVSS